MPVVVVDIVVLMVVLLDGGGRDRGLEVELGTSFSVSKRYIQGDHGTQRPSYIDIFLNIHDHDLA